MGDVFSHPEADAGMARVVHPPPGVIRNAFGGVAVDLEERCRAVRFLSPRAAAEGPAGRELLADLERVLGDLARRHPDLARRTDPADAEAVVYQRLRLHRHAVLRQLLRAARVGITGDVFLRNRVDEYDALVARVARNAGADDLPDGTQALAARCAAMLGDGGGPHRDHRRRVLRLLESLLDHLADDLRLYRSRGRPRAATEPPAAAMPPPPPAVVAAPPPRRTVTAAAAPPRAFRSPPAVPAGPPVPPEPCAVCLDAPCGPRLPCGHKYMCGTCTASVDRCPLCRDAFDPSEVAWTDACGAPFYARS